MDILVQGKNAPDESEMISDLTFAKTSCRMAAHSGLVVSVPKAVSIRFLKLCSVFWRIAQIPISFLPAHSGQQMQSICETLPSAMTVAARYFLSLARILLKKIKSIHKCEKNASRREIALGYIVNVGHAPLEW
jgi:hypothetical protein